MAPAPVALSAEAAGAGPPLLLLHGLFGSASNWRTPAKAFADRYAVHSVDLRNHGASDWSDDMSYEAMAEDLAAYLAAHDLGAATVAGHSMGGKAAMALALRHPARVAALAVIDIAPVHYDHGLDDFVGAMQALDLATMTRRAEADAALAAAVADPGLRGFLLQNLVGRPGGGFAWRLNLAALDAAMATLAGFPDALADATYEGPCLFLSGGASDYVRPEHEPAIRRYFPGAAFDVIPDAGHWVHAERPKEFVERLGEFLDGLA